MKLNKTQTEQLTLLASRSDISLEDITVMFEKIITSEKLASRDIKERSITAMRMLKAKIEKKKDADSFGGKTENFIIRVEMKDEPTEFKRKDGKKGYRSSIYCTALADSGKPFFTILTLWNDANEVNPNMVVGTTYTTKAVRNGNQLSMNNPEELIEVEDKMPQMKYVITDSYPVVELETLELNISEDWNDLKLVKGVIVGAWTITTKSDKMMGFLKIISENDDDTSTVAKFSNCYEQVDLWDDGSLVYVLGQTTPATYDEDSGELQYEASMWGNLIVPIDAFEKENEDDDDDDDDDDDFEDFEVLDDDDDFDIDDDEDWD